MLKNFTVAMLPILALGTDIQYENAANIDKSQLKYWSRFQTWNRATDADSENWIAEEDKKLDVVFILRDAKEDERENERLAANREAVQKWFTEQEVEEE